MSCWSHYEQLGLICILIWQTYWNINTQSKLTIEFDLDDYSGWDDNNCDKNFDRNFNSDDEFDG